jgi:hypothetical protein
VCGPSTRREGTHACARPNRFARSLRSLAQELLNALELHAGPDAYLNIRYMVPSYTSALKL